MLKREINDAFIHLIGLVNVPYSYQQNQANYKNTDGSMAGCDCF